MKSNKDELKKRGYIDEYNTYDYIDFSTEDLIKMLNSKKAFERSIAVRALSKRENLDKDKFLDLLLNLLKNEKSLYTKIEICDNLSSLNEKAACKMLDYIGKIGENQHKELPLKVSKKKSYPLPRDIIARTLGKMDTKVMPVLTLNLEYRSLYEVRELIDAIGYLSFYNNLIDEKSVIEALIKCYKRYIDDDIVRLKITVAISSFTGEEVIRNLKYISENDTQDIVRKEAIRSLEIIKENDKIK